MKLSSGWKKFWTSIILFLVIFPLIIGTISYFQIRQEDTLIRVADYTMKEMDFSFGTWGKGIMMAGLIDAYNITKDQKYLAFVKYWIDQSIFTQTKDGVFSHGETTVGDSSAIGISVLYFYKITNDIFYLDGAKRNMEYLLNKPPKTAEGGISHRMSNLELWIDTLYMVSPFLAELGIITSNNSLIDKAIEQVFIHEKYLRDENTHLYSHIWTWNGVNDDPNLWSRGIGWMTSTIVDLLDIIPKSHPNYTDLVKLLQNIIPAISSRQDPSGLWHTIINDTSTPLETSCTELFAYSIALAVNKSWIEDNGNKSVAIKAFNAVLNKVNDVGIVRGVSGGTGYNSYNAPIYTRAISWGQGLFMKTYKLFKILGW